MKTDPLIRQAKKAYRATSIGKLDALLKEQSFWKRRETIAWSKLIKVRSKIETLARELAEKEVKP